MRRAYAIVMEKAEAFWRADTDLAGMLVKSWTLCAERGWSRGVPFHLVFVASAGRGATLSLMVLKRVIPCLDVDGGRVVKGTNFVDIRDAGDPVELAERYDAEGADELVFLDITASHESRDTIVELARRTADNVFIPFTIGGGIRSVEDAQAVLDAGADKVSVNSAALERPELIGRARRGLRRPVRR